MDLAQATGAAEPLTLGGQEFRVRLLTMSEWGKLSAWIKTKHPSPVTQALLALQQARDAGEPADAATRDALLDHAQRSALAWPPRLGSDAWWAALNSIEGGDARLVYEILVKTDPAFTEARAEELAPKLSGDEWGDLIRVSLWGTHPRPKGDGGTATTTTPPTTPTSGTASSPA